jgi:hypothetical protein
MEECVIFTGKIIDIYQIHEFQNHHSGLSRIAKSFIILDFPPAGGLPE